MAHAAGPVPRRTRTESPTGRKETREEPLEEPGQVYTAQAGPLETGHVMKRRAVILCNRLDTVKKTFSHAAMPVSWLLLNENQQGREIQRYLRSQTGAVEIHHAALFRQRREEFRRHYLRFMADLNRSNASLRWWTLRSSTKDPNSSGLCSDVSAFLMIVDLMTKDPTTNDRLAEDGGSLLVISDSEQLQAQVSSWAKAHGSSAVCGIKKSGQWRRWARNLTPGPTIKTSLVTFYRWFLSRRYASLIRSSQPHVVVASLVYPASYDAKTKTGYRDIYFAPLVDHLARSETNALVVGIVRGRFGPQLASLRKLNGNVPVSVPVAPVESFLTFRDILACTLSALSGFFAGLKIKGDLTIQGVDISGLVRRTFREESRTGDTFLGLWFYRAAVRLAQRIPVERLIYPNENRPWEKMFLLAMREASPKTRLVGYQHYAVSPGHLHLFNGAGEAAISPLPDVLVTTGEFTREWLEREGGYPKDMVRTGCALRQGQFDSPELQPRSSSAGGTLLIALASSVDESIRTLALLDEAIDGSLSRRLVIRPNPNLRLPLELALKETSLSAKYLPCLSNGTLPEDLAEASIVAYASSTVGVEAAAAGTPTIYLDLGKALDTDPMSGWDEFKWTASTPQALCDAVDAIDGLTTEQFQAGSRQARSFALSYLTPVTDDGIRSFLEV